MRTTSLLALTITLLAAAGCRSAPTGPTGPAMTVEWIYGEEGRAVGGVPSFAWREDGQAILWDGTKPADAQTFELLDPVTNYRTEMVDRERAIASLAEHADVDAAAAWRWPDSLDRACEQGLYLLQDDLFLLDLGSSSFRPPDADRRGGDVRVVLARRPPRGLRQGTTTCTCWSCAAARRRG